MTEVENLAAKSSRPPPALEESNGFVQLPNVVQRSTASGYERAYLSSRSLVQLTGDAEASLVGAFCALLFRYSQQETIGIELRAYESELTMGRKVLLNCAVAADKPVSEATVQAAAAIVALRQSAPKQSGSLSNVAISFVTMSETRDDVVDESDSHDIHLIARSEPPALEVAYNARLFDAASVERLADALVRVFQVALTQPETLITRLPVLSAAELHAITVDWDSGKADYPAEPVHRAFERLASQQPEAPAASFEGNTLSYGELDALSSRLAHFLIARGVTPGSSVAVCVTPSLDIVVAFLAIWKAGAVYVPLDPTHPEALITSILSEVQPGVVLTQSKLRSLTNAANSTPYFFDTDAHLIENLSASSPPVKVTLDDRAYVLYTSGTTGKPKGVDARHANLAHYIHVARQKYGFNRDDVFCSLARYTFSISLFELVSPLCCGASLKLLGRDDVLAADRLTRTLSEVTVVHAGPSLLGNLFRYLRSDAANGQTLPRMRHASSGGDLVPPTLLEEMKQVFENAELYVIYGCTEISCMGCTYPIDRGQKVLRTFVGKPFPDVVVRVVDPAGNIMPFGAVGEICFAGKGVVRGYLHRPELTAEKFIEREGLRFYQTGDMGRLHPDGNVEILGRRDYQVQLRGIRVELPGIENMVREIALAEQCATVVKKLDEQDVRLVAFVVKPRETTVAAFRRVLAAHLPDYMLPQAVVPIDALPVTRNGKLDRNALQELPWENLDSDVPRAMPRTNLERQIAGAFAKSLGLAEVGLDDDFFDRGGHSLRAMMMLQELEKALGVRLPLSLLYEHTTVRALAERARSSISHAPEPILLSKASDKPPVHLLLLALTRTEYVQFSHTFAQRLEGHYSVYGVPAELERVFLESRDRVPSISELANDFVEMIRRQQPTGPYRIVGKSFAGIVAYEVAQQLRAGGAEVSFLGLIDSTVPESGLRWRLGQLSRLLAMPFRDILRIGTERLRHHVAARLRPRPKPELARKDPAETQAPIVDLREEIYWLSAERYLPRILPFEGYAELIVAGRRLAQSPLLSPDCGWGRHIPSLRIHLLDSDHMGIAEDPTVMASMAEIFLDGLLRSDGHDHVDQTGADAPKSSRDRSGSLVNSST